MKSLHIIVSSFLLIIISLTVISHISNKFNPEHNFKTTLTMKNNNLFLKDHTELLNIQNQGNITVAQISYDTAVLDSIISLHEAFDENLIIVKELEESERVNTIELENLSESYIFILDGDILKGAKQNRVVNTSVLVAPKSKIILPVSCVEEGRWEYKSSRFKPSDEIAHRSIRYSKANYISESKKLNRVDFVADQSTVWNKVASVSDSLEFHSKTMSHSDLFENYKEELEDISKKFKMQPKANGLLIFVGNQMVACDIFNNNKIYRDYFNKIIKTSAIDSKIKKDNDHLISLDKAIIMQSLNDIFDQFEKSKENASFTPGVSEGVETRLNLDDNTFYGLSHKGESVHQSILSSSSK
jgi:hypothetical protein